MITSKDFNKNFIVKVVSPYYVGLVGYSLLISLLGSKSEFVLNKVFSSKSNKVVVKPFHGETFIFYAR